MPSPAGPELRRAGLRHYDVQPPEPLEEWKSLRLNRLAVTHLYAEGRPTTRQLFTHLKSAKRGCRRRITPGPTQFVIEGEEEVGSETVTRFCRSSVIVWRVMSWSSVTRANSAQPVPRSRTACEHRVFRVTSHRPITISIRERSAGRVNPANALAASWRR